MQAPTVHGWTGYSLPITILQANIIVCIARCLYTLTHNAHEYAQWIKPYVEIGRDAPTRSLHTIALQTWQLASVICTFVLSLVSCELALRWSDHSDTASSRSHPYRISALVYAVEMAKLLLMLPWVYFQVVPHKQCRESHWTAYTTNNIMSLIFMCCLHNCSEMSSGVSMQ